MVGLDFSEFRLCNVANFVTRLTLGCVYVFCAQYALNEVAIPMGNQWATVSQYDNSGLTNVLANNPNL